MIFNKIHVSENIFNPDYALGIVVKENQAKRKQHTEKIHQNNSNSYCEDTFLSMAALLKSDFYVINT